MRESLARKKNPDRYRRIVQVASEGCLDTPDNLYGRIESAFVPALDDKAQRVLAHNSRMQLAQEGAADVEGLDIRTIEGKI